MNTSFNVAAPIAQSPLKALDTCAAQTADGVSVGPSCGLGQGTKERRGRTDPKMGC